MAPKRPRSGAAQQPKGCVLLSCHACRVLQPGPVLTQAPNDTQDPGGWCCGHRQGRRLCAAPGGAAEGASSAHGPLQHALRSSDVRMLHRVSMGRTAMLTCASPLLWFTQADDTRWTARSVTEALQQAVNALPEGPTRRRLQARATRPPLSARL